MFANLHQRGGWGVKRGGWGVKRGGWGVNKANVILSDIGHRKSEMVPN